ncbi:DEAD/DEAH box helicase [Phanerochaete sordida]|uniref:DEAD/DEAH box helicase n=1 Tax=Phanerochaete sordida TaxID=48140 RepID=A0A9P3LIQ6_9APHY|nr:DEAD/DEAH box helicase [Phanerochaete sordida]
MPAFQTPFFGVSNKRKLDADNSGPAPYKRQAVAESSASGSGAAKSGATKHWSVQWRNPQYKKHKTWDFDGVLVVKGNWCELLDNEDGRKLACGKPNGVEASKIVEDVEFHLSGKDIRVDHFIKQSDYLSGTCFSGSVVSTADAGSSTGPSRNSGTAARQFVPLKPKNSLSFKAPSRVQPPSNSDTSSPAVSSPSNQNLAASPPAASHAKADTKPSYWYVNWRKPQQKKHKTWDGDAYLMHRGDKLTLVTERGLVIGTRQWDGTPIYIGYEGRMGNKDFEVDHEISRSEMPSITGREDLDDDVELVSSQVDTTPFIEGKKSRGQAIDVDALPKVEPKGSPPAPPAKKYVAPASFYAPAQKIRPKGPLHDPDAPDAVVLKSPDEAHIAKYNKKNVPVVPVVIDPIIARKLRPHQIEGVKFMYECVMAMRGHDGRGAILADEMGMGKTLQTITLVWTLLKQNPYAGVGPTVGKVMIVCPVSLINNWKNEFHKWLGRDRLGIFTGDKDKAAIKQFVNSRIHHVLIIGYERLRTVIDELKYCIPPIGLIICDEGHRLKSASNKTSTMFEALTTPRRIILSGTPIQNELSEFHAMADFCNPGLLGNYNSFKKLYETPILKSRAPGCSAKERELGEARLEQLLETAQSFVLRRDASILKNYLPPKHEYVVFITPTQLQRDIFHQILTADKLDNLVRNSTAESLALIGMLTKVSNSPILLKAAADKAREQGRDAEGELIKRSVFTEAAKLIPDRAQVEDVSLSGKLIALANLLRQLHKATDEKCIIVSHYTSTLNVIEAFCKKKQYTYLRLDGSTAAQKRQGYVNEFNKSSQKQRFVFLLSSKAGGVGLNLIGASRLCLIDSDWNPSHDLQSMARIHRDGQKRPVFIYRFLTAGSIDEKIYQRQVTKLGLSDSLLGKGGAESKSDSFTRKDLRDIFTIHPNTACHTHELLECPCEEDPDSLANLNRASKGPSSGAVSEAEDEDEDGDSQTGFIQASAVKPEHIEKLDKEYLRQKKEQLAALGQWNHINCLRRNATERIQDTILQKLVFTPEDPREGGTKTSRPKTLLEATDLEAVLLATRPPLPVESLPGGSVSFLFERSSTTPLDDTEVVMPDEGEESV